MAALLPDDIIALVVQNVQTLPSRRSNTIQVVDEIAKQRDNQCLKILRLTNHRLEHLATLLLFRHVTIHDVSPSVLHRFNRIANTRLSEVVHSLTWWPMSNNIADMTLDQRQELRRQQWRRPSEYLLDGLKNGSILRSFVGLKKISTLEMVFPNFSERRLSHETIPERHSALLVDYLASSPPQLRTLRLREVELLDMVPVAEEIRFGRDYFINTLANIRSLDLCFSGQSKHVEFVRSDSAQRLPWILREMSNLRNLKISFQKRENCINFGSKQWQSVQLIRLESIDLRNFEIDQTSLVHLLLPSAQDLQSVRFENIFLFGGTWADVHHVLEESFPALRTIRTDFMFRKYRDCPPFSREDLMSFNTLKDVMEKRSGSADDASFAERRRRPDSGWTSRAPSEICTFDD